MDQDESRVVRTQALRLLKKKLRQSRKTQRRIAVENAPQTDDEPSNNQHDDAKSPLRPETIDATHPSPPVVLVPKHERKPLKKRVIKWSCVRCQRECIPIREESRCLCGHRYKEHPSTIDDPRVKTKSAFRSFACTAAKCRCPAFFYVVAEGAWILRCRCKHKHTDHDASGAPFKCQKPSCACNGFTSPWVCNCNHAWTEHAQAIVEKEFTPLDAFYDQFHADELGVVERTDLLSEPLHLAS